MIEPPRQVYLMAQEIAAEFEENQNMQRVTITSLNTTELAPLKMVLERMTGTLFCTLHSDGRILVISHNDRAIANDN